VDLTSSGTCTVEGIADSGFKPLDSITSVFLSWSSLCSLLQSSFTVFPSVQTFSSDVLELSSSHRTRDSFHSPRKQK
jgi:hypothetical protein